MGSNPTRDSIERALAFAVSEGLIRSWKPLNMHLAGRDYGQAKWEVEVHPSVHSPDGLGTYRITTYQEGKLFCAALASARSGRITDQDSNPGIVLTAGQLREWAGLDRDLTADETAALDECIPNSSIPAAIGTIATEALNLGAEDNLPDHNGPGWGVS